MNGEQYAKAHGVKFDWTSTGYQVEDGWEFHAYTVTLAVGEVTESFTWKQGLGVDDVPSVGEVLYALASDAGYAHESFEDFAHEFGYDTDSRKAYATWEACQHIADQLSNLFGTVPVIDDEDDE